ncbi:hypothetical protein D3C75_1161070 [compost metagenome]
MTCMNARRREKGDIRAEVIQTFLEINRFENRIAGVKFAAAQNNPTAGFILQRQKCV